MLAPQRRFMSPDELVAQMRVDVGLFASLTRSSATNGASARGTQRWDWRREMREGETGEAVAAAVPTRDEVPVVCYVGTPMDEGLGWLPDDGVALTRFDLERIFRDLRALINGTAALDANRAHAVDIAVVLTQALERERGGA
jgi:hypothetical protein